jgi:hypothetical protein
MIHRFMKIILLNSLIVLFLPWSSWLKYAVSQVRNDGFSNHTHRATDEIVGCLLPYLTYMLLLSPALSVGVTRTEPQTDNHVYHPPFVWMVWCADTNHVGVLLCFRRCRMAGYVTTASTNGSYTGEPADTALTWHSICLVVLLCILITVTVVSRPVFGVWTAWYKERQAREEAEHGDRTIWGVGLRPLACWDCGFESHRAMDVCLLWKLCVVLRADPLSSGVLSSATMIFCICGSKSDIRGSVWIRGYVSVMAPLKFAYFLNWRNNVLLKII